MFKCQSPNESLANGRISLGAWELVLQWSLDVGVWCFVSLRVILTLFCSISVPIVAGVSPRFSYKGKKIGTRRLKSYVFSYGDSDARQVGSVSTLQRAVCGHAKAWTPYTLAHRALLKKERTGLSALPCCPERSTYANALRDFHAFCYRVLRLVAPGCSLLQLTEKNCLQTSPARMAPERGQPCPRRFRHRKCRETDARQFFADCQCPTKNWVQAPPAACLTGLGRVVSFCTPER